MVTRLPSRPGSRIGPCRNAPMASPNWPLNIICTSYHREHGIIPLRLRYANVYGPRQNGLGEAGVVAIFIEKFLAGEQPVINGDGRQNQGLCVCGRHCGGESPGPGAPTGGHL